MASTPKIRKPRHSKIRVGILRYLIQHDVGSTPDMLESLGYDRDESGIISDQLLQLKREELIALTECPPVGTGFGRRPICYKIPRDFEILVTIYDEYRELQSDFQNTEWILNKILTERLSLREGGIREIVRQMLRLSPEFFSRCLRNPKIDEHIFRHRILFQEHLAFSSAKYTSVIEEGIFKNPINQGVSWYLPFFGVCFISDTLNGVSNDEGMRFYEELKRTVPDTMTTTALFTTVDNICEVMYQLIKDNPSDKEFGVRIAEYIKHCMDYQQMMQDISTSQDLTQIPQLLQYVKQILPFTVTNDERFRAWIDQAMTFDWSRLKNDGMIQKSS